MAEVAYARTSSAEQTGSLKTQVERFTAMGIDPDLIFQEQRSGGNTDRPKLQECLRTLRKGDVLIVTKLDRVARSARDLQNILHALGQKGVGFRALDQPEIDTTRPAGKLVMGILATISEFERDLIRERQSEGIARAHSRGVKFGREEKATPEVVAKIKALRGEGRMIKEIMAETALSKATVYRVLATKPEAEHV
jgi:DNA invertase Pin-like site-specific DNA recombinase